MHGHVFVMLFYYFDSLPICDIIYPRVSRKRHLSLCIRKTTIGFPTRSDTKRSVQSQKQAKLWNFGFMKRRRCTTPVAKTNALISSTVTAKLICVIVFAYAPSPPPPPPPKKKILKASDAKFFIMPCHSEVTFEPPHGIRTVAGQRSSPDLCFATKSIKIYYL